MMTGRDPTGPMPAHAPRRLRKPAGRLWPACHNNTITMPRPIALVGPRPVQLPHCRTRPRRSGGTPASSRHAWVGRERVLPSRPQAPLIRARPCGSSRPGHHQYPRMPVGIEITRGTPGSPVAPPPVIPPGAGRGSHHGTRCCSRRVAWLADRPRPLGLAATPPCCARACWYRRTRRKQGRCRRSQRHLAPFGGPRGDAARGGVAGQPQAAWPLRVRPRGDGQTGPGERAHGDVDDLVRACLLGCACRTRPAYPSTQSRSRACPTRQCESQACSRDIRQQKTERVSAGGGHQGAEPGAAMPRGAASSAGRARNGATAMG